MMPCEPNWTVRELVVRVCAINGNQVRLGFDGPHRIQRLECEPTARRPRAHLIGPPISIGTFSMQRCALCGETLQQFDLDELPPSQAVPGGLATGRF